jgi:hypothetical protein
MPQLSDTQPNTSNANVVQGLHKRRLTQRLCENGDPLAHKRARKQASSSTLTPSDPLTGSSPPAVSTSLLLQRPETANSSIDNVSDGLDIQPIDVDNSDIEETREDGNANSEGEATELDEDDEAELCKLSISVFDLSSLLVV